MSQIVIVPKIQIDFKTLHDAIVMENYCKIDLGLNTYISDNPVILSVFDVPESALSKIRRRCAIESFSKGTIKVINNSYNTVIGAADFAACRVVAPVAQAGIKATVGIAKVATKATVSTGATLIGSTIENARRTGLELKTDPEVIRAKKELAGAYKAFKNLFGSTDSNEVRIVK